MSRVIIQLVTWNGKKYLPYLFASLRDQQFQDFELRVWDNGSRDGTIEWLETEAQAFVPHMTIQRSLENIGFALGHNQLFADTLQEAEFILLQNQDMMLEPNYLEKLVAEMDARPAIGSCSGRLMKWAFPERTIVIDSLGLRCFENHRVIECGGGAEWKEHEARVLDVFGVSGALPLYRSSALMDVARNGSVFDPAYFSYKEDVDLAWRLRLMGWGSVAVTDAVAFHDRSASGASSFSDVDAIKNHSTKSTIAKRYSYRNHLRMVYKLGANEVSWIGWVKTAWYELKKMVYLIVVAPKDLFWAWTSLWNDRHNMARERMFMRTHAKTDSASLARWFGSL